MKSRRLLHIIASMDPKQGGVSQALRTMIEGLVDLGIHNEVVCMDSQDASFLVREIKEIHSMGPGYSPWAYNSRLIPWLTENLSRFDAVILHGLWLFPGYALKKALERIKKNKVSESSYPKIFVMPHGMLDPYFQRAPERKFKALRNWLYWKLIEGKVVNEADGLLFTCEEERKLAIDTFHPYHPQKEAIVGLGVKKPPEFTVDMEMALWEKFPNLHNRRYFLFLSRIHEKKGVDILIKAYAALLSEISAGKSFLKEKDFALTPNMKTEGKEQELPALVIAGPGLESPFGQKLQALADACKIPKGAILFPGMLVGNEKWGAFYGCEAFVLPSHQENFGIAVVEAMACGKPILISNQINIWREIEDGGAGFVAPDTEQGTKDLLRNWQLLSSAKKTLVGKKAKSVFEDHFSIRPNAERLLEAIQAP